MSELRTPQYWLAELDKHGNPKLIDGSHDTEQDVHHAMYLHERLGFAKGRDYAVAKVELLPVKADATGANEDALNTVISTMRAKQEIKHK